MFSETQRDRLLGYLTEFSEANHAILGLVQVGSGAYGYANLAATVQLYFDVVSEILGCENTEQDYRISMDMVTYVLNSV